MGHDRIVVPQQPGPRPEHVVLHPGFGEREGVDRALGLHVGGVHLALAVDHQPREQRGQEHAEHGGLRGQPHGCGAAPGASGAVRGRPA